jgi:transcriptional regulator with XRE-family HTH domain
MNVEIAQRLAKLRREKGFSQEELAEKLGLSRQAVSKWERAESSPDTDNLIALAGIYGMSIDSLLAIGEQLEDDIAFEAKDRAQQQEAQQANATMATQTAETISQSAHAAAEAASAAQAAAKAAAEAAQSANWPPSAANAANSHHHGEADKRRSSLYLFPYPVLVALVYLVIGFLFGIWHPGWILFLTIPFYYWIARVIDLDLRRRG